jgi:hypothetical protein
MQQRLSITNAVIYANTPLNVSLPARGVGFAVTAVPAVRF